jgi:hypothetical protein
MTPTNIANISSIAEDKSDDNLDDNSSVVRRELELDVERL